MEDALVQYDHYTKISFDEVLILVLMEDALVQAVPQRHNGNIQTVLILVLMEDALVLK